MIATFTRIGRVLGVLLALLSTGASAQVTFTNQGTLLQSVPGTSVADCGADMDQDGLDDIVRVFGNGIYIDYQQPNGSFTPAFYPLTVLTSPSWSIAAADIDGNGWTDLCFGGGSRCSFVYFDGTSFVEDQDPTYIFSQRSTFCDIDNDGNLDAFVCHDVDQSHPYRNVNGILQLDQSLISTLDAGGNYAAIWCDYDNDNDPDLYITKCRGGAPVGDPQRINLMYRNDGDGVFTSVGPQINMNDGEQSWATVFEDFDNDGDFDAFSVNHTAVLPIDGQTAGNRFMRNNGDGTFTNIINSTGVSPSQLGAWNCDAGDFDNNGFVDIFSEMSTEMYWNNGGLSFTGAQLNFNSGGIGDYNHDGFLDVIDGNNLWINNGNANNWVKFDLEGLVSNKEAIGARVEIYGAWGVQIREVRSGESFDPASTTIVHFGIGAATEITQAIIKWPSGIITTIDAPAINAQHSVPEAGCLNDPITITASGNTTICPGESITLSAPAGDSYTWSTGASDSSIEATEAGTYSVVVWDEAGCAALSNNITVTVTTPAVPTISASGPLVFCEGGSVILTSSEGQSYAWSTGESTQAISVDEPGTYQVSVTGQCNGGVDSQPMEIAVLSANEPVVTGAQIGEPGTAVLTAAGDNLEWFASETSADVLGTGNSFTTDFFDTSISYWVQSTTIHGGAMEEGGRPDYTGGGGIPSTGGRLFFDVTEPFTLMEVTVFVPETSTAGVRTIQLFDQGGNLLNETQVNLPLGESVVNVGFEIAPGTGYQIGCAENNLFRNNSGVTFPYAIGTVGSIYNSSFGASYYYYFYNWQIQKESMACVSDRVEATANVVSVNELAERMGLSLFPNPVDQELAIRLDAKYANARFTITDATGRMVRTIQPNATANGRMTVDVADLAAGVYQLVVLSNGEAASIDFVKR
ncbi:MAG: FG-GAP-like repeat-containing protein [Flavobacteriales bacterium]